MVQPKILIGHSPGFLCNWVYVILHWHCDFDFLPVTHGFSHSGESAFVLVKYFVKFSTTGFGCCLEILLTILFGFFNPPVLSIITIPRSSNVVRPISGGESIWPLTMTIVVLTDLVWLAIMTSASPMTGKSSFSAFNLILEGFTVTSGACFCMFWNWCSSTILASEPVSGSACISTSLMYIVQVFPSLF